MNLAGRIVTFQAKFTIIKYGDMFSEFSWLIPVKLASRFFFLNLFIIAQFHTDSTFVTEMNSFLLPLAVKIRCGS